MNIKLLSESDSFGGAAIAARRIHNAFIANSIKSEMWVNNSTSMSQNVVVENSILSKINSSLGRFASSNICKLSGYNRKNYMSLSLSPSVWLNRINRAEFDILNTLGSA